MNQSEGMIGVAVCTEDRLRNAATVNLHRGCVSTDIALKEGLPHLRDQRAGPDHHSTDGDKLINVCLTSQQDNKYTQINQIIAVMQGSHWTKIMCRNLARRIGLSAYLITCISFFLLITN